MQKQVPPLVLMMVELAMQGSGAGVVMVDTPVADDSKNKKNSWHNLACILSLNCSQQAGPTSESGEHSVASATRSTQGAYDPYKLQHGN